MNLIPLGNFVLVDFRKPKGQVVVMVRDAKAASEFSIVVVLAVGRGRLLSNGDRSPIVVKPGDEVLLLPDTPMVNPKREIYGLPEGQCLIDADSICAIVQGRKS